MKTIADLKKFIEKNSIPDDTPVHICYETCTGDAYSIDFDDKGLGTKYIK